MNLDC